MGSLQFDCPLCCNETFTSQQSLRYHLLSIIDNLRCTVCSSRFDTIYELAKHLDGECGTDAPNSNNFERVQIKIEQDEASTNNDDLSNSILAKALLSPKKNISQGKATVEDNNEEQVSDTNENKNEEDEDMYSCSSCGVSFSSIADHINKYHTGQEVVIEVMFISSKYK